MKRLFCFLGWHSWIMHPMPTEPAMGRSDYTSNYHGRCQRCGTTDIFMGPPVTNEKLWQTKPNRIA
jgi:hypothetical protein